LGQNVNAWQGSLDDGSDADFATLLEAVSEVTAIERIRYTTSHPLEFTQRLIDAHGYLPKLAGQVHLPVQSGSDAILGAMKRGYSALEYKSIIRRLREARAGLSISSDFIVGFPGESETDFAATLKLIDDIGFDGCYGFTYSPRPGTPAANLKDSVDEATKLARLKTLLEKTDAQAAVISQSLVGTRQRVLVDGHAKRERHELRGRLDNARVVNFPGDARLVGQFVDVMITETARHSLRGEVVTVS
jgi:tRNA-2-methylthio-N6-dimethylallyladenosine synthase